MVNQSSYQIRLPQFEGPFDLLLFFIERDELDIYNIPITNIIKDFLAYIHEQEKLNIELSSEFILFISTLMRIKAKMLLPRKELDAQGNEIDPRQELVDKILEYKRYKEAAVQMAEMEAMRMLMVRRGNLAKELSSIGEESGEGTEIQTITLFKLMKTFERVMKRMEQRNNKPVHTVVRYNYTMEESREYMIYTLKKNKTVPFERIFNRANDRIQAIFLFLSMLELVQLKYLTIMVGEGRNNFIVEYNENREEDEFGLDGLPNGLMSGGNEEKSGLFGEEFAEELEEDDFEEEEGNEEEDDELKDGAIENKSEEAEEDDDSDEDDEEEEDDDDDDDENDDEEENNEVDKK
ncbi:segregation and condensation protein A [Pseudobacter ginsenosidimutans]|uniref:Segregation and condensation protein A n=1 Tax=Pseudobacter ginsenosidimutans TaxID=661488 RepID=A0A4Q7MW81_9BACT|nr:segregation/condensation protein A [Pseudobacter ginsenosidimutans]RZS71300.1 condensin subunit ScpA [Pseudobacter ginsenosidimutans]